MVDVHIFGMNPGGHHFTNVIFHLVNALLLFFILNRATGGAFQSGFVAALFALHPLHVESVAWISERKDVLSTLFWLLTMWSYLLFVERPNARRYVVVVACFVLGLMAKPMLVTLPFVLLLIDYWPLGRYQNWTMRNRSSRTEHPFIYLVVEKTPLFLLSAASCIITFVMQKTAGAVGSLDILPLNTRIANALISYVNYMVKMVWPFNLAVFYPYPKLMPTWQVAGAGILLIIISILIIRNIRAHPYLLVGWLWYLVTLIPVIGLVQVGKQAMADRYTYIPLIGLFILISWGGSKAVSKWCAKQLSGNNRPTVVASTILNVTAISIVAVLSVATWFQVQLWNNSIALYQHTLDVAGDSYVVHYNLGNAFFQQKLYDNAADHFKKALRINANSQKAMNNLGLALARMNRYDEAMNHYSHAMHLDPTFHEPHNNMGNIFALQGKLDSAVVHYLEAIKINPEYKDAHNNLGLAFIRQGKVDDAVSHFQKALAISPGFASANRNLNRTLTIKKNLDRAVDAMDQAMNMMKADRNSKHKLAMLHNKKQELDQAINNYQKALSIQPGYTKSALNIDNYGKVKRVKQEYRKLLSQIKS